MSLVLLFVLFLSNTDFTLASSIANMNRTDEFPEFPENGPRPRANIRTALLYDDIAVPNTLSRNADTCTSTTCTWPKSGRYVQVPYYISPDYTQREKRIIVRGLRSFHSSTCIRFVPWRSDHRDYIYFMSVPGEGCKSFLGRQDRGQNIYLEKNGCMYQYLVQHEVLHALGFNHEQVRSDRDQHVQILFQNIDPKNVYNFNKKQTNNLGTPYDFTSVMHYGKYDFTWNGQPTIVRRGLPLYDWGKAHQMSANDILRVNRLYRCRV